MKFVHKFGSMIISLINFGILLVRLYSLITTERMSTTESLHFYLILSRNPGIYRK